MSFSFVGIVYIYTFLSQLCFPFKMDMPNMDIIIFSGQLGSRIQSTSSRCQLPKKENYVNEYFPNYN